MSTILFAGGGTLGHIIPAVAVARELQKQHPDISVHFVCSPRGEAAFLEKEHLPHTILDAPRMSWNFPWKFFRAYKQSCALLRSINPSVIFSKGGYIAVPVCIAAHRMKIPIILHESDAVMGRANRLIAKMATHVCLGFPIKVASCKLQKSDSATCNLQLSFTGNPLRSEITRGSREAGLRLTGFSGTRPILLIMGGSQGAQAINEWTAAHLQELTSVCDVIHLTGKGRAEGHKDQGPRAQADSGMRVDVAPLRPCALAYFPLDFAHKELADLYACSDIAMSRAGAGSIAELAGNGIPTILIPLRGVAHDHQVFNAKSLLEREAALLVTQNEMDKKLMNMLKQLIHDPAAREILRSKIREFCIGDSTGQIVNVISHTLAGKQGT
ncbi:hypothetical protein A3C37_02025 [Candidatus Peribacteria bacterium RIFCSPHIGHO2_02_FULL_53_20]|nr:MAG: hypothetical protein A3C37_02025 [Candidatus Peribacteria bacterium RIFCSPHIGHO2_02_FULL_53_20]OGJ67994.1 MAG: hypothetical protein A3B61_04810 [Candidatus Peribacteria bacterium RIFCSPLOWO2_01_FULL_53_10]OGJ74431.1 MAG: hypothetical protein A3G69_01920 [Candidatus Peribacteria bacterium RIFCSPLOWO2_12_FULL_53_10]